MLVIDAVQSDQRSTSLMIAHTRSGGAAISTLTLKFTSTAFLARPS